jgi:hypothetical protein
MDVKTVTMDPIDADQAFREYRAAFMADRNRIDGELMRGYKALAEGKTVISLTDALQRGGVDTIGRPNLAIARADEPAIAMNRTLDGRLEFWPEAATRATADDRVFSFSEGTLPVMESGFWERSHLWRTFRPWMASLPFIPPQYRPPHQLANYHLLWEAEWRQARSPQRKDPMLLRRIGGDLFAVVAAWDLSEIEKLVLAR